MLMIRYFDFNFYLLYLNILDKVKSLKLGDMFWYNIYKYEEIIFSEGHNIRPFVFLKYDKGNIYCLLCSTTRLEGLQLLNDNDKYSYVNYNVLVKIPIYGFINKKGKLYINQIKKLAKKMYFNIKFSEVKDLLKGYIKEEVGDFVLYDNNIYILYGMDSDNVTLYPVFNERIKYGIKVNGDFKFIDNLNKTYYIDIINFVVTKKRKYKVNSNWRC